MCGGQYAMFSKVPGYFTAPANGTYVFEANGDSTFPADLNVPSALSVRKPLANGCNVLGCDGDDIHHGHKATVVVSLVKGEQVIVVVGPTEPYCGVMKVKVTQAIKKCSVNANCPSVPAGGSPKFGYTCISGACVPMEGCRNDQDCPVTRSGLFNYSAQVCQNYKCVPETSFSEGSISHCRFCHHFGCTDPSFCCGGGDPCSPDNEGCADPAWCAA
mmetsp:Transcript_3977/g.6117  ORF Transcript_3977/g.6117 Transcript_3977/m.6117 type:complete len:216 (-) Transcript_3977:688-1335(-)